MSTFAGECRQIPNALVKDQHLLILLYIRTLTGICRQTRMIFGECRKRQVATSSWAVPASQHLVSWLRHSFARFDSVRASLLI
jgi:hypothetical protein